MSTFTTASLAEDYMYMDYVLYETPGSIYPKLTITILKMHLEAQTEFRMSYHFFNLSGPQPFRANKGINKHSIHKLRVNYLYHTRQRTNSLLLGHWVDQIQIYLCGPAYRVHNLNTKLRSLKGSTIRDQKYKCLQNTWELSSPSESPDNNHSLILGSELATSGH